MKELDKLKSIIDKLVATEAKHFIDPQIEIGNTPNDEASFLSRCQALIAEGKLHQSEYWAAHMTPSVSTSSLFGQILAGLNNGNLLSPQLYPLLADIEHQTLDWVKQYFTQSYAHFTAGSSYANLEALWQAREQCPMPQKRMVYGSQAAHYSIAKACQILGLNYQAIPTDNQDRICTDALADACRQQPPLAIVATAGTVACGSIDPLIECAHLATLSNAWFHIDAAWGGALAFIEDQQHYLEGIEHADSVNFDPHKVLMQPKPSSILMYQSPLTPMLDIDTSYLEQPPKKMLAGSRGGELFLPLWCTLMIEGADSVAENIRIRLKQADLFLQAIRPLSDWHSDATTGIVCFHLKKTLDISPLINKGLFSKAHVNQQEVYRAVFSSPSTKADTLIQAVNTLYSSTPSQ